MEKKIYTEMDNNDFAAALTEMAHPADNPSSEHADMMVEAARRILQLEEELGLPEFP
jgi:hypothetical protein